MKSYKKLLVAMGVLTVGLVGCSSEVKTEEKAPTTQEQGAEETMTIAHKYGEVTVPKNPESVAVFDFGALDTMDALGVEAVTGVVQDTSSRPEYLSEYGSDEYTNIGGLKEPNFEALYELEPEIIFISGRQAPQYEELSKIAPVVFMEPDKNDYLGSLENNVNTLAEIFDKEEAAEGILAEIKTMAEEVKKQVEAEELNALITMVSKGEVSVFGAGSRFGIIHDTLGFVPADAKIDEASHGQVVTFEYLTEVNPDYLFVVDKNSIAGSSETAKDTLDNPLVNNTKAAKEGNIVYLDPISWYISPGGITSSQTMIQNVLDGLK